MKLISVVTPPAIYHGLPTQKTFWEENFTLVSMKSCGRRNFRKHRDIKNGEHYIALDLSLKLYCLYKRKATSLEPRDNVGRLGKGMTTSLTIRTKIPNNKQKARTVFTDITNQYFRKLLKKFNNSPFLGYKKKRVHNEPTESYFLLIIHISNLIKIKNRVLLCTKRVKLDLNGKKTC